MEGGPIILFILFVGVIIAVGIWSAIAARKRSEALGSQIVQSGSKMPSRCR